MKRLYSLLIFAVVCWASAANAQNIVKNGDFSAGAVGFSTGYLEIPYNYAYYQYTPQIVAGDYTVGYHCPQSYSDWTPFHDVSGNGQFMIVNGATSSMIVWSQTETVKPHTFYSISFYLAEVSNPSTQANVQVSVNGTPIGKVVIPSVKDGWAQYKYSWFSGSRTTAVLAFTDLNTSWGGNDFGLDNISMSPISNMLLDVLATPSTVTGGTASAGQIDLGEVAPPGGTIVSVASNSSFVGVPPSVTVPEGKSSVQFPISTLPVASTSPATITVKLNGVAKTANLVLKAPALINLDLNPKSVVGGGAVVGSVTLTGPAATSGVQVALSSKSPSASVPGTVTVLGGKIAVQFAVKTSAVASTTVVSITATVSGVSKTISLSVLAPSFKSFGLSPSSVVGGNASTGSVSIDSAAPSGGLTVSLNSNSTFASVPATVTILGGGTTAKFTVTTSAVSATSIAKISATLNRVTKTSSLTVKS